MRAKKPFFASEFGKSSIRLHLGLTNPARGEELAITANLVTRLDQQIDRFGDFVNVLNLCPILR
jgi:hypothetical protein